MRTSVWHLGRIVLPMLAALGVADRDAGAAACLYVQGGTVPFGGCVSDVHFAPILAPGTIGAWSSTVPLPVVRCESWLVAMGPYLVSVAGSPTAGNCTAATCQPEVYYALTSPAGGIVGGWSTAAPLPAGRYQAVAVDDATGFLAAIGGKSTDVFTGPWTVPGVSAWTSQSPLPAQQDEGLGAFGGGYAYVSQGVGGAQMYSAAISGGALSGWGVAGSTPSSGLWGSGMVYDAGFLYNFGGISNMTGTFSTPASGGAIGGWSPQSAIPVQYHEFSFAAHQGFVYLARGYSSGGWHSSVYTAQLSGGTISGWAQQPSHPTAGIESSAAIVEDVAGTLTPTVLPTATRTRTATRTPTAPGPPKTFTPTCNPAFGSATPPFLLVDRNVLHTEGEPLEIVWAVSDPGLVQVTVFNAAGELVRRLALTACTPDAVYRALWDGRNDEEKAVTSNVYVLRLVSLGASRPIVRRVAVVSGAP